MLTDEELCIEIKLNAYKVSGDTDYLRQVIAILKAELKANGENDDETAVANGNCEHCGEKILPYMDYCCGCGRKIEPSAKW